MNYELSRRIITSAAIEPLRQTLHEKLMKISQRYDDDPDVIRFSGIEESFGSINRSSIVSVDIKKSNDGFLIVLDVDYKPSSWFWIFFMIGLLSTVLWILPILFYLSQKSTVQRALERVLERVDNEFRASKDGQTDGGYITALQSLAALHSNGSLTDAEFLTAKERLINIKS